jgi:hypothetical protein
MIDAVAPVPRSPLGGSFENDFRAYDPARDPSRLVDRLLRRPGQIAYEVCEGDHAGVGVKLLLIVLFALASYGLLLGSFSGGAQFWLAPVKVCAGLLVSAAICLPSFYICSCLSGGTLSLARTTALLLQMLSLSGVLLCGFLPVAWLFSQSTQNVAFMSFMHWLVWLICLSAGLRLMRCAISRGSKSDGRFFKAWALVFTLVVFQMSTFVRPLVGPAATKFELQPKMHFVQHWAETIGGRAR